MRTLAIGLLVLSLTGCGSSIGGGGSAYDSAKDVAAAAHCNSPSVGAPGDQEMFVTNTVSCTYNGHDVTIGWFKSAAAMKNYRKVADQFGGGGIAYGSDFVVECQDAQTDCDEIVKAAKG